MQDAFEYLFKCPQHGIFSSGKIFKIEQLNASAMSGCLYPNCKEACKYVGFQPRNAGTFRGFDKMTCVLMPGAEEAKSGI